jgi:capsid protein
VWQRFATTAQVIGALPAGTIEAEWTAPRFEAVDPLKDIPGRHPRGTRRADDAEGGDRPAGLRPGHVLAEIATTNAELDALGIVLDTGPRKATKTGAAKPMEETPSAVSD